MALPGISFTMILSLIILLNFDNFIGPCGKITSFLIHPELARAISVLK